MTGRRNHTGHRVGEWHHRARLTEAQVEQIRRMYRPRRVGYGALAETFGVGESTIRDIITRRTWP